MKRHTIDLFMWGYQTHYRSTLEYHAREVFKQLGVEVSPKVLLVGALDPENNNPNPVCIEPENDKWPLTLFDDLLNLIEDNVKNHYLQNVFYSNDEQGTREKPKVIRQDSVSTAVCDLLTNFDANNNVRSFCRGAHLVGSHYIVPVIQVPESIFQKFPPLKEIVTDDPYIFSGFRSFIHSCMSALLSEVIDELQRENPGHSLMGRMKPADEIVRKAAVSFMQTPGNAVTKQYTYTNLLERLNLISSLMYEGVEGKGQLILVDPDNAAIDYVLRFRDPVLFQEPRWARKILQMALKDVALIADSERIYGLGKLNSDYDSSSQDIFNVFFLGHYHWEIQCQEQVLLVSHYGEPKLPQEHIDRAHFINNYVRLFPESSSDDQVQLWKLYNTAVNQKHGSMIVIAADAVSETKRLTQQGTVIEPTLMTEELFTHVSDIDGTIILDPHGICYAIGVILDGEATTDCTPSRGSRYNSGLRYINAGPANRLAIIVSDDNTVDIIPILRPQIKRGDIELNISALEKSTLNDYHKPRSWLEIGRAHV